MTIVADKEETVLGPNLWMLIGVPGSGKSTYVSRLSGNFVYVSSDYFVEKFAEKMGKSYDEVFKEVAPRAMRLMYRRIQRARRNKQNIVWDQTNVSAKSRTKKLEQLPEYYKVAIFFETPADDVLAERLANRPGKAIPDFVMNSMKESLEFPTVEEGWDAIVRSTEFKGQD